MTPERTFFRGPFGDHGQIEVVGRHAPRCLVIRKSVITGSTLLIMRDVDAPVLREAVATVRSLAHTGRPVSRSVGLLKPGKSGTYFAVRAVRTLDGTPLLSFDRYRPDGTEAGSLGLRGGEEIDALSRGLDWLVAGESNMHASSRATEEA